MTDDEAYATFRAFRFADTGGEPSCPQPECKQCTAVYEFKSRRIFKCKRCDRQFSLTSGTIFASRKMSLRDILFALAVFTNGASGVSALRLSREIQCDYKTAFVLLHKIRQVIGSLRPEGKLTGRVEADGLWVGGYIKPANKKKDRIDRRKVPRNMKKAQSIVSFRETRPGGRTLAFACKDEAEGHDLAVAHVAPSARLRTDSAAAFSPLELVFQNHRMVNHNEAYWQKGIHTNQVESLNARYRRAETGVHNHIAGPHLQGYADELAWREDHRRVSNGIQWGMLVGAAARHPTSARARDRETLVLNAPGARGWQAYWKKKVPRLEEMTTTGVAALGLGIPPSQAA